MTKIERTIAAIHAIEAANVAIAHQRGILARAHSRPRTGTLVPRFETEAEHAAFRAGWDATDAKLAG